MLELHAETDVGVKGEGVLYCQTFTVFFEVDTFSTTSPINLLKTKRNLLYIRN